MEIRNKSIDGGKAFDWGRTSEDYAKYRDIYPSEFFARIAKRGLGVSGQRALDLGTGTGVLPRGMYGYGAKWVGADSSAEQIALAKRLSREIGDETEYICAAAEDVDFSEASFDVITACQCFWYFDCERLAPKLSRMLADDGRLLLLYMAWLPFEDEIAGASEALALKYSPDWSGAGETVHAIEPDKLLFEYFEPVYHEEYAIDIPFTRESWHGRMRTCRGIGASLNKSELAAWENEHRLLLKSLAPDAFTVKHYAAMLELKKK